ncbi:Gfo/Idh/MocA family oxidoreductase [Propionibacteriaceae bacterium Y2011]|uniref:Gfo/Idh/MocA family oxidoreductase n=1 Tax=Microlunatus sp. Y2014 TaxID=3418488 RepID=UPI003B4482D2
MPIRRYGLCGLSNRGVGAFALPLLGSPDADGTQATEDFSDVADLVGIVEPDATRVEEFNRTCLPSGHPPIPRFDDLAAMLAATSPDAVIVASPDHTHAELIIGALDAGIDVIAEKPMVTTTADAEAVLAAQARSSATLRVTHNFRYLPRHVQLKELLRSGVIGRPVQVLLEYHVDTSHGASYFMRWNRERALSGGLSLHKSTHHLDLLAWLLDDEPVRVGSVGGRWFYGPDGPYRPRGEDGRPLSGDAAQQVDPYWQDMVSRKAILTGGGRRRGLRDLPYTHQYPAGSDWSVFDEEIDIEDTLTSVIGYASGAAASYLINFSSPWEGSRIAINGTHGMIESLDGHVAGVPLPGSGTLTVRPLFGEPREIPADTGDGGHGGADPSMRIDLFRGVTERSRELGLVADAREGALAVATGEALWRSAETGEMITIELGADRRP